MIVIKKCIKCGKVKKFTKKNFYPRYNAKGLRGICKICCNENDKKYKLDNKKDIEIQNEKYYNENKEKRRKIRLYNYQNDQIYKLRRIVSGSIRSALKGKKGGKSVLKNLPYTMEELRKHIEDQFKIPGNEWMNWDNYGVYKRKTHKNNPTWQLDHIKPHSDFHYEDMECQEFQECWALSNLQPLDSEKNLMDGVNRTRHKK